MSNLAFNAAPFNPINNETKPHNRRNNKTIKKRHGNKSHVYNMKKAVKQLNKFDSIEEQNNLSNFEPMTAPKLNNKKENINLIMNDDDNEIKPKNFEHVNTNYQKHNENNMTTNYYSNSGSNPYITNEKLLEKLNHIIEMLEEQKDQRTDYVSEELVLYSFLGVFIIFVVDSFARVGKYIR